MEKDLDNVLITEGSAMFKDYEIISLPEGMSLSNLPNVKDMFTDITFQSEIKIERGQI